MAKELKSRSDGMVNVTLDPDAVRLLDDMIEELANELGFRPTRSQGLRYLLNKLGTRPDGGGTK